MSEHRLSRTAILAVAGSALILSLPLSMPGVDAATASPGTWFFVAFAGGDVLGTYDHTNTDNFNDRGSVDWTLTMFFMNNAEIDKVKGILGSAYPEIGGSMYEYLSDGSGYSWDSDRGRKTPSGCSRVDTHARLYADGDDRLYNTTDGYYVVASTHRDYYERQLCGTYYGYSEAASNQICTYMRDHGYRCDSNAVYIGNPEPTRNEGGNHPASGLVLDITGTDGVHAATPRLSLPTVDQAWHGSVTVTMTRAGPQRLMFRLLTDGHRARVAREVTLDVASGTRRPVDIGIVVIAGVLLLFGGVLAFWRPRRAEGGDRSR